MNDRDAMISAKADLDGFCEIDTCENAKLSYKHIKELVFYNNTIPHVILAPVHLRSRFPKTTLKNTARKSTQVMCLKLWVTHVTFKR